MSIVRRRRVARLTTAVVIALIFAVQGLVPPALADWTMSDITTNPYLFRPSLAIDGSGHNSVAYGRYGADPGIMLSSDAEGSWLETRLSSGNDFDPSLFVDSAGSKYVAFVRYGPQQGIYLTSDLGGTWSAPVRLTTDTAESPSIGVDSSGRFTLAYVSDSFNPGLYVIAGSVQSAVAGLPGSFNVNRLAPAHLDAEPSVALDGSGHVAIAWARYAPEGPGIMFATNATGSWVVSKLTSAMDDVPALAVDQSGKDVIAFRRYHSGRSGMFKLSNAGGPWVTTAMFDGTGWNAGEPAVAIDAGLAYLMAPMTGGSEPSQLFYTTDGIHAYQVPTGELGTDTGTPSIRFDTAHVLHLAFQGSHPAPGINYYSASAATLTMPIESVQLSGSTIDTSPSLSRDPAGASHVAFDESTPSSGDGIRYGTSSRSGWTFETATSDHGVPALASDAAGSAHLGYDPNHYLTNASGSWVGDLLPNAWGGQVSVAVDGAGHAYAAYESALGFHGLAVASNKTGTWVPEEAGGEDIRAPSVAVDAANHVHVAYLEFETSAAYVTNSSGKWASPGSGVIPFPTARCDATAIAIDGNGKVHMVFHVADGWQPELDGTYYVTNKSGSWTGIRLTRTSAESSPSLAVDAAGHAYIAMTRYDWAADPGVYLVTDRTGGWTTTQLVQEEGAVNASVTVDAKGNATVVYEQADAGLTELVQSDPGAASHGQPMTPSGETRPTQVTALSTGEPSRVATTAPQAEAGAAHTASAPIGGAQDLGH
jgi:hypothetical protein